MNSVTTTRTRRSADDAEARGPGAAVAPGEARHGLEPVGAGLELAPAHPAAEVEAVGADAIAVGEAADDRVARAAPAALAAFGRDAAPAAPDPAPRLEHGEGRGRRPGA